MKSKTIFVQKYPKYGYEVRTELVSHPDDSEPIQMRNAYTASGDYIGDRPTGVFLCEEKGIKPETIDSEHKVCSIGFCEVEQRWYGWSHRAIFGFGVGSIVSEGDCAYIPPEKDEQDYPLDAAIVETRPYPPGTPTGKWTAKTLDDAKQMAIDFANGVA